MSGGIERSGRSGVRRLCAYLLLSAACFGSGAALAAGSVDGYPDEVSWVGSQVYSLRQWPSDSGWGISYFKVINRYLAGSIAYLNDAHFPGHHRDGVAMEVWVPLVPFGNRLNLSAGGGSFYYYDTVFAQNSGGYADAHGWAWLASVRATYQPFSSLPHLFIEGRIDYTAPSRSIETTSIGLGVGYRGISDSHRLPDTSAVFADNEVVASYGKTVTNSFDSSAHQARAASLDYRRRVWRELRMSVGYLYEGDTQLVRRSGIMTEGWAEPSFASGLCSIGVGFGFYAATDKYRPAPGRGLSEVVSATLSIQPTRHLDVRFLWHRIVTNYNRDADILLWGIGYRF